MSNEIEPTDSERPDSRHGWAVAVVGAVAMVFTFGTPMSYGIFREPFSELVGVSPIALSGVFSIMLFTLYIGSGLVGIFGVHLPARLVLLGCAVMTGLLAPLPYVVDSLVGIAVIFAILGLTSGSVFVLVSSIIPRWFDEKRGAATGLIFVGNGLGLFILPPLWQFALSEIGVRLGFLSIISITALTYLAAGLVCRRPQWVEQTSVTTDELFTWIASLSRNRTFQLLYVGIAFSFAWYQLLAAYAVDLFVYRGLTEAFASAVFGLIGGVSIISRIGGGYLADRFGSRQTFLVAVACTAVGIGLLFVPHMYVLLFAVFLIGIGLGATATLYIPLLLSIFSPEKDTAVVGVFSTGLGVAVMAMPPLGAASVSYTDGFGVAILLTFLVTVLGLVGTAVATR